MDDLAPRQQAGFRRFVKRIHRACARNRPVKVLVALRGVGRDPAAAGRPAPCQCERDHGTAADGEGGVERSHLENCGDEDQVDPMV
jgi:hypothetical protein